MESIGKLESISIDSEPFIDTHDSHGVQAILREIEMMLGHLINHGECGVIDMKTIPISHDAYQQLQYVLGSGELSATINALGKSTVRETAIAGVWWIIHYNDVEEVIADLIEVTSIPEILRSDRGDMRNSLEELRRRIEIEQPLSL